MGAAAHVGRVGGLAVALGVGSALFAGPGLAWAEGADSATSDSSASATPGGDAAGSEPADGESAENTAGSHEADDQDAPDLDAESEPQEEPQEEPEEEPEIDVPEDADEHGDPDTEPAETPESESALVEQTQPELEPEPEPASEPGSDDSSTPAATRSTHPAEGESFTAPAGEAQSTAESPEVSNDPAAVPREPDKVAVFAGAPALAAASPVKVPVLPAPSSASTPKPSLITAVVNVVNSMLEWARQRADATPDDAPQPPFLWALLSFARRELENLFAAGSTVGAVQARAAAPTSLALAAAEPATAAAAAVAVPYSPWLNPQVSESTNFVSWVTGKYVYSDETMANTLARFQIYGTDVGTMWWNGMEDDPNTPSNENQVLIAVGDSYGGPNMSGRWIYNTLFRSSDQDLSDAMTIPNGEWFNGNMFGGAPLSAPTQARPIINRPSWLPNSVTLIPTAGVSVPTPGTQFGVTQYVSFMSVSKWGSAGRWDTNYSAIAYSTDNGENFTVAPESVRYNSILSGNKNFQQSAFVTGDDGYVYVYGTPNGRQGAAYVSRVQAENILDLSEYEYYKKASSGWFGGSAAEWVKGNPSAASAVIGKDGGICGSTKPGYTVSEMSVQYNEYLDKYVVLYGDQFNNIVMRTSDTPEGTWSGASVLMGQQAGGIYAPMLHPWSPSTLGTGSDLYWNLSLWSDYNVMLMRTDLTKV